MEMPDREKVLKGLECCASMNGSACRECPYSSECIDYEVPYPTGTAHLAADALELLKEQKHGETFTVIDTKTGKEADTYNIALHEDWAKNLCYCDMEGWAIENDGTLLLVDECGQFEYADRERFKVVWDA